MSREQQTLRQPGNRAEELQDSHPGGPIWHEPPDEEREVLFKERVWGGGWPCWVLSTSLGFHSSMGAAGEWDSPTHSAYTGVSLLSPTEPGPEPLREETGPTSVPALCGEASPPAGPLCRPKTRQKGPKCAPRGFIPRLEAQFPKCTQSKGWKPSNQQPAPPPPPARHTGRLGRPLRGNICTPPEILTNGPQTSPSPLEHDLTSNAPKCPIPWAWGMVFDDACG